MTKFGTASGMGVNHYGGWVQYGELDDEDINCYRCQHCIENPSDIFGSCFSCAVNESTDYSLDRDEGEPICRKFLQSTKCSMTRVEYEEFIKQGNL